MPAKAGIHNFPTNDPPLTAPRVTQDVVDARLRGHDVALALIGLSFVVALAAGLLARHCIAGAVPRDAATLRAMGGAGALLFVALIAALTLIGVVPGALLGIGAGAVYGIGAGFLTSGLGVMAGAVIAFALARSMLRPLIAAALGRRARLAALDDIVTRDRWRIVFLLRVSPVLPFSLTSYALGLSGIAFRDYLLGTLAALPPLLGYVVLGTLGRATIAAPARQAGLIHAALLAFGIAATLALTLHLTRLLGQALRTA